MTGFLDELLSDYRGMLARHRNRPMLHAAMAACALAAAADGEISFGERIRVDRILETLEELKVFDPHVGVNLFNDFTQAILASPREGRAEAIAAVQAVTADPETAALVVRICLAVAESKPEKSLVEQIEIVMLCSLLGVEPSDAGLHTQDDSALRKFGPE